VEKHQCPCPSGFDALSIIHPVMWLLCAPVRAVEPAKDPQIVGDPLRTLFIGRLKYVLQKWLGNRTLPVMEHTGHWHPMALL
jgi:hypothetical protein